MKLLDSLRSKMSGQTREAFGDGQRFPLTKSLINAVRDHNDELRGVDMSKYQFERRHSDYPATKSEIVIYDPQGELAFHGRENNDGRISIWR